MTLGIDAVWLSPIFSSPMKDFGYDVSDFRAVDPIFGTLDDFDRLLAAVHARGMKLILDDVPNHTSDRHAWFVKSRSARSVLIATGTFGETRVPTACPEQLGQ